MQASHLLDTQEFGSMPWICPYFEFFYHASSSPSVQVRTSFWITNAPCTPLPQTCFFDRFEGFLMGRVNSSPTRSLYLFSSWSKVTFFLFRGFKRLRILNFSGDVAPSILIAWDGPHSVAIASANFRRSSRMLGDLQRAASSAGDCLASVTIRPVQRKDAIEHDMRNSDGRSSTMVLSEFSNFYRARVSEKLWDCRAVWIQTMFSSKCHSRSCSVSSMTVQIFSTQLPSSKSPSCLHFPWEIIRPITTLTPASQMYRSTFRSKSGRCWLLAHSTTTRGIESLLCFQEVSGHRMEVCIGEGVGVGDEDPMLWCDTAVVHGCRGDLWRSGYRRCAEILGALKWVADWTSLIPPMYGEMLGS